MKKIVAISIFNHRIAPVFDVSLKVLIIDTNSEDQLPKEKELPKQIDEKILAIKNSGVEILLCGAISIQVLERIERAGIEVYPFARGSICEILSKLKEGKIDKMRYTMPGCYRRGRCVRR
ncbi:MAG: dinitrogenase iron-molybdenum cofactor biosynthesis protein [Candidatus Cloacimonadota bacterium]|nr:MAG: dinitrogenase iron-molybdenum cofactor biosynthesis protein [Candidatus Cloacimonadota bacterium]PIE78243.1 MAG: dinitrogenase iron-molybdenum cofactor biosynthesis protein [Candidatus Delongbacteria bacterium]